MISESVLDLDEISPEPIEFDVSHGTVDQRVAHSVVPRLLALQFRQALGDCSVAMNFFLDEGDHCLRVIEYIPRGEDYTEPSYESRELAPVPEVIALLLLEELKRRSGLECVGDAGFLKYKLDGKPTTARLMLVHQLEIRVYFLEGNPPMRSKLVEPQ